MKIYVVYNLFSARPVACVTTDKDKAIAEAVRLKGYIQVWENNEMTGRIVQNYKRQWVERNI